MTIGRKQFLPKIRSLGYSFKRETKRASIYRKSEGVSYLHVPKSSRLTESYVRNVLRQNGLSDVEIDEFILQCSAKPLCGKEGVRSSNDEIVSQSL